jgi:competence protein ComEC
MLGPLLALSTGILMRNVSDIPHQYFYYVAAAVLLLLPNLKKKTGAVRRIPHGEATRGVASWRHQGRTGLALLLMLAAVGAWRCDEFATKAEPRALSGRRIDAVVRLTSAPRTKSKTLQATAEAELRDVIVGGRHVDKLSLPLYLYLPKDSLCATLGEGDVAAMRLSLFPIQDDSASTGNSFARHLHDQGIGTAAYASKLHIIGRNKATKRDPLAPLRHKIQDTLDRIYQDADCRAFVGALLIGQKELLTAELRGSFARAGLAHILAVSGMHTGIIYLLLCALLLPLTLLRGDRVRDGAALLLLWGYALLTGMPASVVRAVGMLSILLLGKLVGRGTTALSNLYVTAFLILLIDPRYISDVGFQLSFLSVWSILLYNPRGVGSRVGQLLGVTLAAQVLVLPLCIYRFGLVPLWFAVSNLLVLPLLTPLMLLTVGNTALRMAGGGATWLDRLAEGATEGVIRIGEWVASLPGPFVAELQGWELAACYLVIAAVSYLWMRSEEPA